MNWDDVRLFLALARKGSARSAAAELGISHTTLARRSEQLEAALSARLFERGVDGFRLTGGGEAMLESALRAEEALLEAERRLMGRDSQLSGNIRLTTSAVIANYLMMPGLARFMQRYPEIDLEILLSYDLFDLSRREADIAIRFVGSGRRPPEDLVGRRLMASSSCYYASPNYLETHDLSDPDSPARWVGWDDTEPFPRWVRQSPFPHLPVHGKFNHPGLQVEAARAGVGIVVLPCFMGDTTPDLVRIPGCEPYDNYHIWLLSHPDLREAARMRAFKKAVVSLFEDLRPLLTGQAPHSQRPGQ